MSMDTNKEAQGIDREQIPETITFRTADRMTYGALGYDGNELMAFISGYDLEIKFNLRIWAVGQEGRLCSYHGVCQEQLRV